MPQLEKVTRRDLSKLGLTGAAVLVPDMAAGLTRPVDADLAVDPNGGYIAVPLAKDTVRLGIVQTRISLVEIDSIEKSRKANLAHMLDWVDRAQANGKHDLLLFHELPLTGLSFEWGRDDVQRAAIEIPGEETEEISKKAREHDCYIVFGSYARDADWPGHNLSLTTIIGPDGAIVDKQWKVRNIKGVLDGGKIELMTSTIYNVLDQYVEMYGADAVIPVARTPIGNISTSSAQREPEFVRGFAVKGCEILLRTATGRYHYADVQAGSLYNEIYSAMVINSYLPENIEALKRRFGTSDMTGPLADSSMVFSAVFGPDGTLLEQAPTLEETIISVDIPISDFRAKHTQPLIHAAITDPVMSAYRPKYEPGLFSSYLPVDSEDAAAYLNRERNWS